jgi:hypothetical protein
LQKTVRSLTVSATRWGGLLRAIFPAEATMVGRARKHWKGLPLSAPRAWRLADLARHTSLEKSSSAWLMRLLRLAGSNRLACLVCATPDGAVRVV